MSRWYLYILQCADSSLYTGIALDPAKRLAQHRVGKGSKFVRSRLPARLVYKEACRTRSAALKREAQIKSWPRRHKLVFIKHQLASTRTARSI